MSEVVGVVAEFNPFHDGHAYLLEQARKRTGARYVVCAMSGDYVQRGECAVMSKYARAQEALRRGADAVLGMPVYNTVSAAGEFALSYIRVLLNAGADAIAFGCEDPDIAGVMPYLKGHILPSGSVVDKWARVYMRMGESYPAAREKALREICGMPAHYIDMIKQPNNLLVYEYLKAVCELGAADRVEIIPIKREGMGHDALAAEEAEAAPQTDGKGFVSAAYLRGKILAGEETFDYVREYGEKYHYTSWDDLSDILYYKLLYATREELSRAKDVSDALAGRILSVFHDFQDAGEFILELKNKSVTYTRLSRAMLQVILGLDKRKERPEYAYLLGYREDAMELLGWMKSASAIPFITRVSDAKNFLDKKDYAFYRMDARANALFVRIAEKPGGEPLPMDYMQTPLRV